MHQRFLTRQIAWALPSPAVRAARRRKILFVYGFCGLGGVETSTLTKLAALRQVGIEASVLFTKFYGDGARSLASLPGVMVGIDEQTLLAYLRDDLDAVIVIDHPDFIDFLIENQIHVPLFYETHSAFVSRRIERFYKRMNRAHIKAIVVPSSFTKRLVYSRANPSCEVVVIPNAVDTRFFRPQRVTSSFMPHLFEKQLVLWVGRLEEEKNPHALLEIADQVLDCNPCITFLVVGDRPGRYEEAVQSLVDRMQPRSRSAFHFLRAVPHERMPELYNLVRVTKGLLLSTSLYESLPMTFMEAMACGCRIVASEVGGVRDLIIDGYTGRLFPRNNSVVGAKVVNELLSQKNTFRHLMSWQARRHIRRRFCMAQVAKRYRRLLDTA